MENAELKSPARSRREMRVKLILGKAELWRGDVVGKGEGYDEMVRRISNQDYRLFGARYWHA